MFADFVRLPRPTNQGTNANDFIVNRTMIGSIKYTRSTFGIIIYGAYSLELRYNNAETFNEALRILEEGSTFRQPAVEGAKSCITPQRKRKTTR